MKKGLVLSIVIASIATIAYARVAHIAEANRSSLRGLRSVYVMINYSAPHAAQYGLTPGQLRSDVELALSADNIHPMTNEEWTSDPREPYLLVTVEGIPIDSTREDTAFLFDYRIELIQQVRLERDPRALCEGATWSEGYFGVLSRNSLRAVPETVVALAQKFAHAVQDAYTTK
jgi:hypothetical protein